MNIAKDQKRFRHKRVVVRNMKMVKRQRPNYWNRCRDYTDLQEQNNCMICIAFKCSLDLYNISNRIVNQTCSIMNKSFFKVKKPCRSAWLLWLSHNNSFAPKAFFGHWRYSPRFIRLEIPINFVGNKMLFYFAKDLV